MSIFLRIKPILFPWKGGKDAAYGRKNGNVFIYRQSRHFFFIHDIVKVLFLIFSFTWRVNRFVSRQEKGIKKKNKGTNTSES